MRASRGKSSDALGVLRSRVLVWDTNRQLFPPFFAAASQRSSSPFRFHPRTKTVRFKPSCVTRTVSWLSHKLLQVQSKQNYGTDC